MTRLLVAALALSGTLLSGTLLSATVRAEDPLAPVAEVMRITAGNWADDGSEPQELFTEERLDRLFSRDFSARYRAAAAFPAMEGGTSPFDYDVIVNAQDGCPLTDLSIARTEDGKTGEAAGSGAPTLIVARFNATACFNEASEVQAPSEVRFTIIDEDGRSVIDDIQTEADNEEFGSLKAELDTIARQ
ncbi:hypothetical protein H1W37_09660 [Stappia taiwanensis]|uniref:Uncharacterized protein n=1 Tax=Stappia taiwanensis TaxID=992267 RepID=A0A838XQ47_9HYPH|nr:hypothetical protein [Stappia taiwanensis]MBA4611917.1 hypothetical protein [Stappia taiwanensis]GGF03789.1 hypothetical protein GCM10007285_34430 [Stappia taiwanensis]